MTILVAIKSCVAHAWQHQLVRQTWLAGQDIAYKFFVGNHYYLPNLEGPIFTTTSWQPCADEIVLNCDDSYQGLPFKTQAIVRWALDHDHDFTFFCDDDTYACIPRVLKSGFAGHDYSGFFYPCVSCKPEKPEPDGYCHCVTEEGERIYSYASGGSGYWISRKAMEIVAAAQFIADPLDDNKEKRSSRGEDLQVGWALGRAGIRCHCDERYRLRWPGPRRDNNYITLHDNTLKAPVAERLAMVHRFYLG